VTAPGICYPEPQLAEGGRPFAVARMRPSAPIRERRISAVRSLYDIRAAEILRGLTKGRDHNQTTSRAIVIAVKKGSE